MTQETLVVRGAREHNLKNITVELPRDRLIVITGLSGSGKSSLAFDTIYAEGQRRYVESLSAYARQFLGRMEKPKVERIDGLSPTLLIDQKTVNRNPRSTVGTITEIHDHLRLLFARLGEPRCPACGAPVGGQTVDGIVGTILQQRAGRRLAVLAPVVRDRKGEYRKDLEGWRLKGFTRAWIDGVERRLDDPPELKRNVRHTIELVVDRLRLEPARRERLAEAVETAATLADGLVTVRGEDGAAEGWSTANTCPEGHGDFPELEPRLFSFNSPHGACPDCQGLGVLERASEARVVRDPELTIREGALAVTRKSGGALAFPNVDFRFLEQVARAHGFDLDTPWRELSAEARALVLKGTGEERYRATASWAGKKYQGAISYEKRFRGVLPALERAWKNGQRRSFVERFLEERPCPECGGSRLKDVARAVRVADATLPELSRTSIGELPAALERLPLAGR